MRRKLRRDRYACTRFPMRRKLRHDHYHITRAMRRKLLRDRYDIMRTIPDASQIAARPL